MADHDRDSEPAAEAAAEPSVKKTKTINDSIRLSNGQYMPLIGLGTWKAADPKELKNAIFEAIENNGYRHLDCAAIYGNEEVVGEALQEIWDRGKVKRSDVFIVSKLWNTHHHPNHVRPALEQTLKDLKLEYLDLYLMHWPVAFEFNGIPIPPESGTPKDEKGYPQFAKVSIQQTWKAMEDLVPTGLVKGIGVSNFRLVELLDLLTYANIKPAVNQVECHPFYSRKELLDECRRHGIELVAYSPFGGSEAKKGPLADRSIQRLAKKHKKTTAQIIVRWLVQRHVAAIPKSVQPQRIKENMDIYDFELSEREVDDIESLNRDYSYIDMRHYWGYPINV